MRELASPRFVTNSSRRVRRWRILVDDSLIDVFSADGQVVLTDQIFPDSFRNSVSTFATGGTARVDDLRAWNLKSIWKQHSATNEVRLPRDPVRVHFVDAGASEY